MQPVAAALIAFNEQLIIVLLGLIGVVHQDHRISHRLLNPRHPYIHGAPCQVITRRRPSNLFIQLRTPIPAINYDRLFGIYFPS